MSEEHKEGTFLLMSVTKMVKFIKNKKPNTEYEFATVWAADIKQAELKNEHLENIYIVAYASLFGEKVIAIVTSKRVGEPLRFSDAGKRKKEVRKILVDYLKVPDVLMRLQDTDCQTCGWDTYKTIDPDGNPIHLCDHCGVSVKIINGKTYIIESPKETV